MARLLLLDDEPNILAALRRCLLAPDDLDGEAPQYKIDCHGSPEAALRAAEATPYDLVISDYRMPGMDGVAFLTELRYIRPDCVRIILSGMTDLDGMVRAVNKAEIYRFVAKPWNDYELRASVHGALAHRQLLTENQRLADQVRLLHDRGALQAEELARLERETPGITRVRWGADGAVLMDGGE